MILTSVTPQSNSQRLEDWKRKRINNKLGGERMKRFNDEEVLELLDQISGDSRDNWLNVGMALHAQYDGKKKGFELWDEWASKFEGYVDTDDNRYHWDRFNSDGGISPENAFVAALHYEEK